MNKYKYTILECGKPDRNGFIFTKSCAEKILADPIVKEMLDTHSLFDSDNTAEMSAAFEDLKLEANEQGEPILTVNLVTLDTMWGKVLEKIIEEGNHKISLSLHGMADVDYSAKLVNTVVLDYIKVIVDTIVHKGAE